MVRVTPLADSAWSLQFAEDNLADACHKASAFHQTLQVVAPAWYMESVCAFATVAIWFDVLLITPEQAIKELSQLLPRNLESTPATSRHHRLPVVYGGTHGPDLESVAACCNLTTSAVISLHTATTYRVACIGFAPGFPYLTGLPAALATPRLAVPRRSVPAGTVCIADRQTGIYPVPSPGGWHLLGWTPAVLFHAARRPPARLQPGDEVTFFATTPGAVAAWEDAWT